MFYISKQISSHFRLRLDFATAWREMIHRHHSHCRTGGAAASTAPGLSEQPPAWRWGSPPSLHAWPYDPDAPHADAHAAPWQEEERGTVSMWGWWRWRWRGWCMHNFNTWSVMTMETKWTRNRLCAHFQLSSCVIFSRPSCNRDRNSSWESLWTLLCRSIQLLTLVNTYNVQSEWSGQHKTGHIVKKKGVFLCICVATSQQLQPHIWQLVHSWPAS